MSTIQIQTNDGEKKVVTLKKHQQMITKYGEDNLPYVVITKKQKVYGGPEPYPPGYRYTNY